MPSSRGGGSFGGGGGSFGGGSRGGGSSGGGRGPRFSSKRAFPGARRYYYYDRFGARHFFFYAGVPVRRSLGSIIFSTIFGLTIVVLLLSIFLYLFIPHKLKASKCTDYGSYVLDESNLFTDADKEYLSTALQKFYKDTGVQPFVYAVSYENIPVNYTPVTSRNLENYAYEIYVNMFQDEGHCLILYARDTSSVSHSGLWIEMTGDDAQNVFDDDAFKEFQNDLNRKLNTYGVNPATAIADAFTENIDTVIKLGTSQKMTLTLMVVFFLIIIGALVSGLVQSIKQAKQINEYCDYRDKNGGADFTESFDGVNTDNPTGGADGSDLFD